MDEQGPGLHEAVTALTAAHEMLGTKDLVATYATKHGLMQIVVDDDGWQLFAEGEPVPMLKGGLA